MAGLFKFLAAAFAAVGALFAGPHTVTIEPQSSAVIYNTVSPDAHAPGGEKQPMPVAQSIRAAQAGAGATGTVTVTSSSIISTTASIITPNLLPKIDLKQGEAKPAKAALAPAFAASLVSKVSQVLASPPPLIPTAPQLNLQNLSAETALDNATISFKQRRDGVFNALLAVNQKNTNVLSWTLDQTSIGGGAIQQFSTAYSCDPEPLIPPADAISQEPQFAPRTNYACDFSLTPLSGDDRRTITKHFAFTTGAGQLLVTPPSAMDTVLVDGTNNGGFVFDNQDTNPVTITGVTIDDSYNAISTLNGPMAIRFLDPVTETSMNDHHIESIPADPASGQFAYAETGAQIPLSFTIPANTQKMLPIQVLGVHKMTLSGVNPVVKITLKGVTINRTDEKSVLNLAQILWTCTPPTGAYDPNATSGAFASGQACKD